MEESLVAVLGKHILDKSLIHGKVCNYDDDSIDRLNHIYTTALFGLSVTFMFTRQLVGKPISCWLPSEFTDSQVQYAEHVCWVMSTYYVKLDSSVPFYIFRKSYRLHYYQWYPFVLIGQGALYMVPYFIWGLCNRRCRKEVILMMQSIVNLDINTPDPERYQSLTRGRHHFLQVLLLSRSRSLGLVSSTYKSHYSGSQKSVRTYTRLWSPVTPKCSTEGYLMIICYLSCKALYLSNNILQLIIMSKCFQLNNKYYGWDLLMNLLFRENLQRSESTFPRITFCDFEVMALGQSLRYTSQCVLAVNMFNEKIYLFLWLWNIMLGAVNLYSFLQWCYRFGSLKYQRDLISSFLTPPAESKSKPPSFISATTSPAAADNASNLQSEKPCSSTSIPRHEPLSSTPGILRRNIASIPDEDPRTRQHKLMEFISLYLKNDGTFLIQLISHNLGRSIASQFVQFLWDKHKFKTSCDPLILLSCAGQKKSRLQSAHPLQLSTNTNVNLHNVPVIGGNTNQLNMHQLERGISSISFNEVIKTNQQKLLLKYKKQKQKKTNISTTKM